MADFYEGFNEEEKPAGTVLIADGDDGPEDKDEEQKNQSKGKRAGRFGDIFDCVETFFYALVLMILLFVFVFRFVTVNGTSMINTLKNQDRLIISGLMYKPETGDIVVLDAEGRFQDRYIIKRVIATGGQTVDIDFESWAITVDGKELEEDYVNYTGGELRSAQWIDTSDEVVRSYEDGVLRTASFTVPKGKLFVMGDNRNGSSDSRLVGWFDEDEVLGRVLIRVGPLNGFGRVE